MKQVCCFIHDISGLHDLQKELVNWMEIDRCEELLYNIKIFINFEEHVFSWIFDNWKMTHFIYSCIYIVLHNALLPSLFHISVFQFKIDCFLSNYYSLYVIVLFQSVIRNLSDSPGPGLYINNDTAIAINKSQNAWSRCV